MSPPVPVLADDPVTKLTSPLLPASATPVLREMSPLTPLDPASALDKETAPEDCDAPLVEPLAIVIEPPEAEEPLPPAKFTEPPAELPCPDCNVKAPPAENDDDPATKDAAPPAPPEEEPDVSDMSPPSSPLE